MSTTNDAANPTCAAIVIATPAAARVFERFGIDYCCHGDRPLDVACADAGADLAAVRAALEEASAIDMPHDLPTTIAGLIEHIVATHHTYLRRELPRLRELMTKVQQAHGTAYPEVHAVSTTLDEITDDLLPHLLKEERVLFPMAIELMAATERPEFHCGTLLNPIRVMHMEHDRVGDLLAVLRRRTCDYLVPPDACPTWRALWDGLRELEADTHQHVHLENNVLFPMILSMENDLTPGVPPWPS